MTGIRLINLFGQAVEKLSTSEFGTRQLPHDGGERNGAKLNAGIRNPGRADRSGADAFLRLGLG